MFVHLFWSLSDFFCLLTKKVRVSKKQPTNTEKSWKKKFVEKLFFKSSSDFQQKSLNNQTKNIRRIVKTTFNVFRRTILGRFFGMKKLWSTFLVVERNYWTFAVNFLSNFSKLQPTGAAERFEALLERSVILWSFLVSERKLPYSGKIFRQVANVQFTCPQQKFEKIF